MYFARMKLAVRRQWALVAVGVVLTLGGAWYVARLSPPAHSITATVLLLPPTNPSSEGPSNPYLQLGGLTAPAEILARAMNDPEVAAKLASQGVTSEYVVARDMNTSAPIVLVSVQDPSMDAARKARDAILEQVPVTLHELQSAIKVQQSAMLTSAVVTREGAVSLSYKSTMRAVLLTAAFGLLVTLIVATLIDSLRAGRRQDRRVLQADNRMDQTSETPTGAPELVPETRRERRSRAAL